MRIANIENGNSCPTGWKQVFSPVKACRAISDNPGCYSAHFDNSKFSYQHICGKVIGYQKGTPDAYVASKAIDGPYVDGVFLTYGTPRKRLFTYASGHSNCPCAKNPGPKAPSFVRDNYYCESGSHNGVTYTTVYHSDPLWDGKVAIPCGMEKVANSVTVAVHRLAHHGSTEMS